MNSISRAKQRVKKIKQEFAKRLCEETLNLNLVWAHGQVKESNMLSYHRGIHFYPHRTYALITTLNNQAIGITWDMEIEYAKIGGTHGFLFNDRGMPCGYEEFDEFNSIWYKMVGSKVNPDRGKLGINIFQPNSTNNYEIAKLPPLKTNKRYTSFSDLVDISIKPNKNWCIGMKYNDWVWYPAQKRYVSHHNQIKTLTKKELANFEKMIKGKDTRYKVSKKLKGGT